jgi:flagellar biosynthesis anti-sigma factor FlgM
MKINDVYAAANAAATQPAAAQTGKPPKVEAVPAGEAKSTQATTEVKEADRVQLSELSEKLTRTLGVESAARASRLERLEAEVRAGRYSVDALAVSQRLVDETLGGG